MIRPKRSNDVRFLLFQLKNVRFRLIELSDVRFRLFKSNDVRFRLVRLYRKLFDFVQLYRKLFEFVRLYRKWFEFVRLYLKLFVLTGISRSVLNYNETRTSFDRFCQIMCRKLQPGQSQNIIECATNLSIVILYSPG